MRILDIGLQLTGTETLSDYEHPFDDECVNIYGWKDEIGRWILIRRNGSEVAASHDFEAIVAAQRLLTNEAYYPLWKARRANEHNRQS